MNSEVENLKLEIEVLKKRVAHLEGIENRRKIIAIIKVLIVIIMIGIIAYFALKLYGKYTEMYGQLEEFYKNPLKSFF